MNQKRFIILLTLLIFFLIHVDKTHGSCYPIGVRKDCDKEWDSANIIDASWVPGAPILNITTYVPDGGNGPNYPEAFGHFTFGNDQVKHRFLKKPIFVNDHHCTYTSPDEKNPYVSYWPHDGSLRPAPGTWVGIWLAIYWRCNRFDGHIPKKVQCCHKNVFKNIYVNQ
ncbi:unnamed protein product [Rhizophagus irregularis]|nr:unnamed protein product [Rhizophagus irregularis]